jgi:hypothetical protein
MSDVEPLFGDDILRRQLQEQIAMTASETHASVMARLPQGHSISLISISDKLPRGNCFAFAFELVDHIHNDPVLTRLADPPMDPFGIAGLGIHPDGCFVRWLWVNRYFITGSNGDIWLYFASGRPVHAARGTEPDSLTSKWGGGHIWRHSLEEVPSSYGTHFARVQPNTRLSPITLYREYVRRVFPEPWKEVKGSEAT